MTFAGLQMETLFCYDCFQSRICKKQSLRHKDRIETGEASRHSFPPYICIHVSSETKPLSLLTKYVSRSRVSEPDMLLLSEFSAACLETRIIF